MFSLLSSLKVRITVGAIATLVLGVGLVTAVLIRRIEQDTLRDQVQRELSEAARTATVLARTVTELQQALAVVGEQLDATTLNDPAALERFVADKLVLRSMFANVYAAAADGRMLAYADREGLQRLKLNLRDRAFFRAAVAEQRPVVSAPLQGRLSGQPVIALAQPLRDAGGVYGVIGGGLRLSSGDLLARLVATHEVDTTALAVVTDLQGLVIAHPDQSRLLGSLAQEPRLAEAFAAWKAAGQPVEPAGLQLPQRGELVSAAGVPGPGWMVWQARPESELLAPLRAARGEALGWAAALIVLVSTLIFALVSVLLRPLARLERRSVHLFDAALAPAAGWPEVSGEIGRLSAVLKRVGVERATLEASNNELLQRLRSVMSASPIGIAFTRAQRFELVSAEFCRLFQRREGELVNAEAALIYANPQDYALLGPAVAQAFAAGQPYVGEWQMRRADGSLFWAQLRGRPVDTADPRAGTIWSVADISEQKQAQEALAWTAAHDALTGLANRREFERRAAGLVAALPGSLPAAIVFIDLDHFKPVNDLGGHAAGDAMLVAVAAAIGAELRASDLVARIGGDEFAVLLERCPEPMALRIAEKILQAIAAIALPWEQQRFQVGASLGVAALNAEAASLDAWLASADAACYEAKAAGRGQVRSASAGG